METRVTRAGKVKIDEDEYLSAELLESDYNSSKKSVSQKSWLEW